MGSLSVYHTGESVSKQTAPIHSKDLFHDAAYNNAEIDCPCKLLRGDGHACSLLGPGSKS